MDLKDIEPAARAVLGWLDAAGPLWYVGAPVAVVLLTVLAVVLRRWAKGRGAARVVATLATVLGLSWSAQGMWDAAVNHYGVAWQLASVLFIVFEAMLVNQMFKSHEYRDDLPRRARFVRAVWIIACVMGLVVAFGEGLGQAPLRLSVPLLVAYNWWLDLTADDDPDAKPATSLRWTPREIGLAIGMLRITDADRRDPTEAERKYLADRIAKLAFNLEHGEKWMNKLTRRNIRLARLKLDADPAMLAGVHARLVLSRRELESATEQPVQQPEVHPVMPEQPAEPVHVPTPEPTPEVEPPAPDTERRPQGWHRRINGSGIFLRGADLETDAVAAMAASIRAGTPLTNDQLAALYDPPLGTRNAQKFGARGRLTVATVNGVVNGAKLDELVP